MIRRILLILLLLTQAEAGRAQTGRAPDPRGEIIRIGVRVDTRPFAWRDPVTGDYRGFLVDLCNAAVIRTGFPFRHVPVDATERMEILQTQSAEIDLLCDPTTISLSRLQAFAAPPTPDRLRFSPIVFVANGVWVRNPDEKITTTPAPPDGVRCLPGRPDRAAGKDRAAHAYLTAGFVVGTTAEVLLDALLREDALPLEPDQSICPVAHPSHVDGVSAFCRGELAFYFGDLDIVRETAKDLVARGLVDDCEFDHAPIPISYEPYALVVTDRTEGFRPLFMASLYAVFADRISRSSTAEHFFDQNFEELDKSPFLDALFRINRLPPG